MLRFTCIFLGLIGAVGMARAADDPWQVARDQVAALRWTDAASSYRQLRDASAKEPKSFDRATFALAVCLQHEQPTSRESIVEATKLYHELINAPAAPDIVARSMMNLGRIAELIDYPGDQPDLNGARTLYQAVMSRWPDEPIGSEAALRAGASLVMAYDAPKFTNVHAGLDLLQAWLRDHAGNVYASIMWQYCGDAYFHPLNDSANALRCYQQVDQIGWPDAGNQGACLWKCSQIAELYQHDTALAIHFYTELLVDTPGNSNAYKALVALRRLGAPIPSIPQSLRDDAGPTTPEAP